MPETLEEYVDLYGRYCSISEACVIACCSRKTIDRLIRRGELELFKIGSTRTYRVRTADAFNLIQRVA